jgi:FG-GAP-like repeat/Bacterial Ig-like domain (group 3)
MESAWRLILRTSALTLALLPALHAQVGTATQTTLAISPSATIATGKTFTLIAKVSSSGAPVNPGVVLFCNAKALHCEDSAILGSAQLTAAGTASLPLRLSPNTYSIKAIFSGTPHSATPREPSTSATQTLTVTGLAESSVYPVTASQSSGRYKLSATVAGYGTVPLAGTVTFNDTVLHGTPLTLGSATLPSASPSARLSQPFIPPVVPGDVLQIITGDFNGDGLTDVIAFNYDDNQRDPTFGLTALTTYLSNGDGTFRTLSQLLTLSTPTFGIAGDFNNDGILDLAVADAFDCVVVPMLGNGDGSFTVGTAVNVPTCATPPFLTGDLNGDGNLDLMLVGSGASSVLSGNSDGTFTFAATQPGVNTGPAPILKDINGDGIPDLYVGSNPIQILTGNGNGTFTPLPPIPYPHTINSLDVADFNGDGFPDLLAANSDNTVGLLLGSKGGTFSAEPTITLPGPPLSQIAAADFNGDGKADALVLSADPPTFTILLGNGFGAFNSSHPPTSILSDQPFSLGDFNGDGLPDVTQAFLAASQDTSITQNTGIIAEFTQQTKPAVITSITIRTDTDHTLAAHYSGSTDYKPSVSSPFDLLTFPNITSKLRITSTGFIFSHVTNTFNATLTVTNTTTSPIAGPIQLGFSNLPETITLANPTVLKNEGFITIPAGLAAGKSTTVPIRFNNPFLYAINYTLAAYTGAF